MGTLLALDGETFASVGGFFAVADEVDGLGCGDEGCAESEVEEGGEVHGGFNIGVGLRNGMMCEMSLLLG